MLFLFFLLVGVYADTAYSYSNFDYFIAGISLALIASIVILSFGYIYYDYCRPYCCYTHEEPESYV